MIKVVISCKADLFLVFVRLNPVAPPAATSARHATALHALHHQIFKTRVNIIKHMLIIVETNEILEIALTINGLMLHFHLPSSHYNISSVCCTKVSMLKVVK